MDGDLEYDGDFPPYIIRGSPEEAKWRRSNPNGHKIMGNRHENFETGSTMAHKLAAMGSYDELQVFLNENEETVTRRDKNGWTALAEGARTGNAEIVRLLLDRGSEMNARVGPNEEGGSILWLARETLGEDHEVVSLLKERGARIIEPSVRQEL